MKKVQFLIEGMHCTSCAMNIDGELEDTAGIISANTNYAKQKSAVEFDPDKISESDVISIIKKVGYKATQVVI